MTNVAKSGVAGLIYKSWTFENFKDLFKLITGQTMPVILSNFIYGYTSVLANENIFRDKLSYNDFSFKTYHESFTKLYASNLEKINAIDPQFANIFQKPDGSYLIQDLKNAIQKEASYFHFLRNLEATPLCVFKGGFLGFLCHITSRYISYYHTQSTCYMELEDVENALEKTLRDCHRSVNCTFSFDYGWENISDWLSLADTGKKQLSSNSAIMTQVIYFSDCVTAVLNQKTHQRNIRAIAVIKNAAEDFKYVAERVEANLVFMNHIENTNTFKAIFDSARSNLKK